MLKSYLAQKRTQTSLNQYYPIFTEVQVAEKRDKSKLLAAFVISEDSNSKYTYCVGYEQRDRGFQDVLKGQVTFPEKVLAIHNATSMLNHVEPRNYDHAKSYPDWPEWKAAIDDEVNSIVTKKVVRPIDKEDIPKDKQVVGSRMVSKLKLNADGTIDKYKVRIAAQGFSQVYGSDFDETFSPVARLESTRIVLVLTADINLPADCSSC